MRLNKKKFVGFKERLSERFEIAYLNGQQEENMGLHRHDYCELVMVVSGKVAYKLADRVYYPKPGNIILIDEHVRHSPQLISSDTPYERITLALQKEVFSQLSRPDMDFTVFFRNSDFDILQLPYYTQAQVRMILGKLLTLKEEKTFGLSVLCDVYLTELFVKIAEHYYGAEEPVGSGDLHSSQLVSMVDQYIIENIDSQITIDEIAFFVCKNKYSLMRSFKEISGCTLYQYILNKRLEIAENLILEGDSFSKAAEKSGFSDYSCFYRSFKKKNGVSPQAYFEQAHGE